MALVLQNGSLLRSGNSLASGADCCCDSRAPYSGCGNLCAFRVQVKEIDSELAACNEELPQGWSATAVVDCEDTRSPATFWVVPWLDAYKAPPGEECESYEGIVDIESNPKYCFDFERAGIAYVIGSFGYTIGGERSFSRAGFTGEFPNSRSFKNFDMAYEIGIYCFENPEREPCSVCGGASTQYPRSYYVAARLSVSVAETRYEGNQFVGSASKRFDGYSGLYANLGANVAFLTQACEDMNSFTRLSEYDCAETAFEGCRGFPDFFPDNPLEITVSVDDGIEVAGQTFSWESVTSDTQGDFEIDFPDDLKSPGGITVYRAAKCCCDAESGYCDENPLP